MTNEEAIKAGRINRREDLGTFQNFCPSVYDENFDCPHKHEHGYCAKCVLDYLLSEVPTKLDKYCPKVVARWLKEEYEYDMEVQK